MHSAQDEAAVALLVHILMTDAGIPPPMPVTLSELIDDAYDAMPARSKPSGSAGFGYLGQLRGGFEVAKMLIEAVIVTLHTKEIVRDLGPKAVELMRKAVAAVPSPRGPELVVFVLNGISQDHSLCLPASGKEEIALNLEAKIAGLRDREASKRLTKVFTELTQLVDYLRNSEENN